jgi:GNAT superfamily N-acetyltransferase
MENIEIKRVTLNDIDQLQTIGKKTFFETFSNGNTKENMANYLSEGFSIKKLTDEIKNKNSELYFAILNEKAIGYLKLNFGQSQTEIKNDNALEIERIYVLKDFYGKNIGKLLYEKALSIAKQKKVFTRKMASWNLINISLN